MINPNAESLNVLARGRRLLELAISAPHRVPSWDLVVLTAAHETQADLYRRRLETIRSQSLLPPTTQTLVVSDPEGKRIGSGGATLHALNAASNLHADLRCKRVLLIHSGGDSKRVPWAAVFGKVFIPVPLLADVDAPVPTLFDQLIAITAPIPQNMPNGGLAIFTGDVLPLFDCAALDLGTSPPPYPKKDSKPGLEALPTNKPHQLIVTKLVSLDIAARHGVVVAHDGNPTGPVRKLLQKPSVDEITAAQGLVAGALTYLDTGIFCFVDSGWRRLLDAAGELGPEVIHHTGKNACSLYEDIAGAMTPGQHDRVRQTPLGPGLLKYLGDSQLHHQAFRELAFLHFGSQPEIIQHFAAGWDERIGRRLHSACGPDVGSDATVLESLIHEAVPVGRASLISGCELGAGWRVGAGAVVVAVRDAGEGLTVLDHHALWHVPIASPYQDAIVVMVAGIFDDPKRTGLEAIFCNRTLSSWLNARGLHADDIWPDGTPRELWHAKLFPVAGEATLRSALAVCLLARHPDLAAVSAWRASPRLSYAELGQRVDALALDRKRASHLRPLLSQGLKRAVKAGLDRNIYSLARLCGERIEDQDRDGVWPSESRRHQVRSDLLRAAGRQQEADEAAERAYLAVRQSVAAAVPPVNEEPVKDLEPGRVVREALPIRFDFAGGWTDTPPICLERPAHVCNFAVVLKNAGVEGGVEADHPFAHLSVGADVETLEAPRFELELGDGGEHRTLSEAPRDVNLKDPFLLPLTALRLCGYSNDTGITQGVRVRTWSKAPRGSGMGASSILGAALVRALQRAAGRSQDIETVANLVLVLEQRMTTGGGWQDQLGGLAPGVKLCSSVPTRPLRIRVEQVPLLPAVQEELEARMVFFFTGQQRLARNVLQIVVGRYLRRESTILDALDRLSGLALESRAALSRADLDALGAVMAETWQVHQQLDANCSNPKVDEIFRSLADLSCGAKLAGAGGGGVAALMAKDREAARRVRARLTAMEGDVCVYDWGVWSSES